MMSDLSRALFSPDDPILIRTLTFLVLALAAFAILGWLSVVGELIGCWYRETVGSWWADRHARRERKYLAQLQREMDEERQRQSLNATFKIVGRR